LPERASFTPLSAPGYGFHVSSITGGSTWWYLIGPDREIIGGIRWTPGFWEDAKREAEWIVANKAWSRGLWVAPESAGRRSAESHRYPEPPESPRHFVAPRDRRHRGRVEISREALIAEADQLVDRLSALGHRNAPNFRGIMVRVIGSKFHRPPPAPATAESEDLSLDALQDWVETFRLEARVAGEAAAKRAARGGNGPQAELVAIDPATGRHLRPATPAEADTWRDINTSKYGFHGRSRWAAVRVGSVAIDEYTGPGGSHTPGRFVKAAEDPPGRVPKHWAVRVVISKVGSRTCTAKVYDNNGHLMSGFQSPTDCEYVERKIAEWFPGVPIEREERSKRRARVSEARRSPRGALSHNQVMKIADDLSGKVRGTAPKSVVVAGEPGARFLTYSPNHGQPVVVFLSTVDDSNIALDIYSDENTTDRYENVSTFLYGPDGYTSKRVNVNDMLETIEWVLATVDGYAESWQENGGGGLDEAPQAPVALTVRLRATLAWVIEDWPWQYRGQPTEDMRQLEQMGLVDPATEDQWGGVTALGEQVWHGGERAKWIEEWDLGAAYKRSGMTRPRRHATEAPGRGARRRAR
jgi:hypothetical protein